MNNTVDINYIDKAIDELIDLIGIKENVNSYVLLELLRKGKIKECIKTVALYLGLPIEIRLSYVTKNDKSNKFETSEMVKTDYRGIASAGIVAQVLIPKYIPPYGSSSLNGYIIDVKVSKNCTNHPSVFISVIAHELSHLLLATYLSKHADNEFYTDLTPLILGFASIINNDNGRKVITSSTSSFIFYSETTTNTTTYGYLNDDQFNFAINKISKILKNHISKKREFLIKTSKFNRQHKLFGRYFRLFRKILNNYKINKKMKIISLDSVKLNSLYNPALLNDLYLITNKNENRLQRLNDFRNNLDHYTNHKMYILNKNSENTDKFIYEIKNTIKKIEADLILLIKYLNQGNKIGAKMEYFFINLSKLLP